MRRKKRFSLAKRQSTLTGGGPPPMPPINEELMVLRLMPSAFLVGHADSYESAVDLGKLLILDLVSQRASIFIQIVEIVYKYCKIVDY